MPSIFVERFEVVRALEDMWSFKSAWRRAGWVWLAAWVGCSDADEGPDVGASPQLLRETRFDSVADVALKELASNVGDPA